MGGARKNSKHSSVKGKMISGLQRDSCLWKDFREFDHLNVHKISRRDLETSRVGCLCGGGLFTIFYYSEKSHCDSGSRQEGGRLFDILYYVFFFKF